MKQLLSLLLVLALSMAGCGSPGGSQGDANDPAIDGSDAEQFESSEEEEALN
ncbi:MAG: hypothetical protein KatS3mg111_1967 [Pirellulaceae bacterium]|nr:MAG: hypothetical protein KatS3mg111_1967 [Pirellulaceae bacterium]